MAAKVYLKTLKTAPPVMPGSIIPSYCTVKYVTALSINFAELGVNLASVVGAQVIRKALNILPNRLPLLKAVVCWVGLFPVFLCKLFSTRMQH